MKDYYEILQVSPRAEPEVIDAAFRRLARKYHPDVYSGPDVAHRMRELNEAYEVLGDPHRRAEYDAALGRTEARGGARRPQEDRPPPPPPPTGRAKEPERPAPEEADPWRPRFGPVWLGVAGAFLLGSMVLLGAGLAVLLLTGDDGSVITNVGDLVTSDDGLSTAAATPLPGPPPNDSPLARMIIEKIGVDAPIITLGLDEQSVPQVPDGPGDIAWYDFSTKPGWGSNAVFSGHVDWTLYGQPVIGVFYYLRDLGLDDEIKIVLEDGTEYRYKVTANQAIEDEDPTALAVMGPTPNDMVTIITAGGIWIHDWTDPLGGHYTHRQVVQAELIEEEPLPPLGLTP